MNERGAMVIESGTAAELFKREGEKVVHGNVRERERDRGTGRREEEAAAEEEEG